jgi:pimeloyl-ACP methyl ester carboxylesterase
MRSLALALAALALSCGSRAPSKGTLPLEPCQLSDSGSAQKVAARCGRFEVPEDRSKPDGKKLSLHVAVVPAKSTPRPDPVVFLAGGPGQAASESALMAVLSLNRARDRDILLVDQRGTGRSNPLRCPTVRVDEGDDAAVAGWLDRCLKELPGDPKSYTTSAAMKDLDEVRAALGYEKLNLFGVSYGTRAALVYMREYPERVRTAILDGVAPTQLAVGEDMDRTAARALEMSFARCAKAQPCAERFGDLGAHYKEVLARLEREKPLIKTHHPTTGEPVEISFGRQRFSSIVFLMSYMPEMVSLLPLFIRAAHERQDFGALAAQTLFLNESFEGMLSRGMQLSVLCAEDIPFFKTARGEAQGAATYLGTTTRDSFIAMCRRWPHAEVAKSFKDPVQSSAPVLLLSGEADPVTPPEFAELAKQTLPNARHAVLPGHGHNVSFRGCVPRLIAELLKKGSTATLDVSCAESAAPPPFFLDPLGPPP